MVMNMLVSRNEIADPTVADDSAFRFSNGLVLGQLGNADQRGVYRRQK